MGKFSGSWPVLVLCVMDCLPGALSLPTKKKHQHWLDAESKGCD